MYLADVKAGEALRFFVEDVDRVDLSAARTVAAELDKTLDRIGLAFEDRLDRAVRTVRHPAFDTTLLRHPPHGVAKEHPLHVPVDDDAAADHAAYSRGI